MLFFTVKTVKNKIFNKKILDKKSEKVYRFSKQKEIYWKNSNQKDYTKKYIDPEQCIGF